MLSFATEGQMDVSIKDEPSSPSSCYTSGQAVSEGYNIAYSMNEYRSVGQGEAPTYSEGSPVKRAKNGLEELQSSNSDTKRKLKNAVIDRRRATGKSEFGVLFEEPKASPLTSADIEKREKRKEQNRRAAKKCRTKKRELQSLAQQETVRVEETNKRLQQAISHLRCLVDRLSRMLYQHLRCGDCKLNLAQQELDKQMQELIQLQTLTTIHPHHLQYLQNSNPGPVVSESSVETRELSFCSNNSVSGESQYSTDSDAAGVAEETGLEGIKTLDSIDLIRHLHDYPEENMDEPISPQTLDDALRDIERAEPASSKTTAESSSLVDHQPSCVSGLANLFDQEVAASEPSLDFLAPFPSHGSNCVSFPGIPNEECQTLTSLDDLGSCVSPNLIQPNFAQLRPVSCALSAARTLANISSRRYGISSLPGMEQFFKSSTDANNNTDVVSNTPSSFNRNRCRAEGEPHGYQNYFTFDSTPHSPEFPQNGDPISPFYTQGGNSRL